MKSGRKKEIYARGWVKNRSLDHGLGKKKTQTSM